MTKFPLNNDDFCMKAEEAELMDDDEEAVALAFDNKTAIRGAANMQAKAADKKEGGEGELMLE